MSDVIKILVVTLLVALVFLKPAVEEVQVVPSSGSVGIIYNSTTNTWDLWNSYHHYYINSTSGFQMSNIPDEWWSHNLLCFRFYAGGVWREKCIDSLPWTWSNYSNGTFAELNGTVRYTIGSYDVAMRLRYRVDNNDRRMMITPYILNLGTQLPNATLVWRIHDIKVNNTEENDWGSVIHGGSPITHQLNDTRLNHSSSNLDYRFYHIADSVLDGWMWTWWDENATKNGNPIYDFPYTLRVWHDGVEHNAHVDLEMSFGVLQTNDWVSTNLWWEDAICSWTCGMTAPSSPVEIQEGEEFQMTGVVSWSGTCSGSGSYIRADFSNGSYNQITSSTNLSTSDRNPQYFLRNGWPYTFDIAGDDLWDTLYYVRFHCYFNLMDKDSAAQSVNVSEAEQMVCTALSADKTLNSDENECYYFTNDNIDFDCNGHTMYGNNDNYGISTNGHDSSIIKNCNFENYTKSIHVNQSENTKIYNTTMAWNNIYTPGIKQDAVGVYIEDSRDTLIENVTQWNFTVDRDGTSGAGGHGIFVGIDTSNNTQIINTRCENNTGDYHSGGADPVTNTYGYGILAVFYPYDVRNITIRNYTSLNHSSYAFYLYQTGTAETINVSDVVAKGNTNIFSSYQPFNLDSINISTSGLGVGAHIYAHYSNISNVKIEGNTSYGVYVYSSDYGTLENVSISGESDYYSIYLGNDASGWTMRNVTINNTQKAIYNHGSNNKFDRLVLDNYTEGVDFLIASNTQFSNSTFYPADDFLFDFSFTTAGVKVINSTGDWTNVTYGSGTSDFTVQWYARVNVTDSVGGALEATINDTDNQSSVAFYSYDDLTDYYIVNDTKYSNGGNVFYNWHYILVNKTGYYDNSTNFNFSYSDATVNLSIYASGVENPDVNASIWFVDEWIPYNTTNIMKFRCRPGTDFCSPIYQTTEQAIFNITNNGTASASALVAWMDYELTWVNISCSDYYDTDTSVHILTAPTTLNDSATEIEESHDIFCWANLSATEGSDREFNMTFNYTS